MILLDWYLLETKLDELGYWNIVPSDEEITIYKNYKNENKLRTYINYMFFFNNSIISITRYFAKWNSEFRE